MPGKTCTNWENLEEERGKTVGKCISGWGVCKEFGLFSVKKERDSSS